MKLHETLKSIGSTVRVDENWKIVEAIEGLQKQLTGDMMKDMNIRDEIHNLQMKLNGIKPMDSQVDCIGCGS